MRSEVGRAILIHLIENNDCCHKISKDINRTYCQTAKIMKQLEESGLVKIEKLNERTKIVKLTEKGREIAIKLKEFEELLK